MLCFLKVLGLAAGKSGIILLAAPFGSENPGSVSPKAPCRFMVYTDTPKLHGSSFKAQLRAAFGSPFGGFSQMLLRRLKGILEFVPAEGLPRDNASEPSRIRPDREKRPALHLE